MAPDVTWNGREGAASWPARVAAVEAAFATYAAEQEGLVTSLLQEIGEAVED